METSTAVPQGGVSARDVPSVAELFERPGPFLSVAMSSDAGTGDGGSGFARRWNELRRRASDDGAPEEVLDEVGSWLAAHRLEGAGLAVIGAVDGRIVGASGDSEPLEQVTWDALPDAVPFIQWHQSSPPALMVVADRTGADLFVNDAGGGEVETVEGETGPVLTRTSPGGWSQRRYQDRAELVAKANAVDVAEAVRAHAERIDARLVVLAGDDRTCDQVVAHLPDRVAALVRRASGGRHRGSEGDLAAQVGRWYRTAVAEDTVAILDKLKEELGQHDRGVCGWQATTAALRSAAAELLVVSGSAAGRRVCFAPDQRLSVALDADDLDAEVISPADGVGALVRAAWAGGAKVRVVPAIPELADGVGALLRYPSDRVAV